MSETASPPQDRANPASPKAFMRGPLHAFPADACVHHLFERQAASTPSAVALECQGVALAYRELNEQANRLAHRLRSFGVRAGSRVGVSLHRSIDAVVAIYAVMKAGGAYVPIDPTYPADRRSYMIEAAGIAVLVTDSSVHAPATTPPGAVIIHLDRERENLATCPIENPRDTVTPDDLIYVIFTSGSTGRPKGAAVRHRGFSNLLHWFTTEFSISSKDHTLLVSSLSFDLTQKNLFAPLLRGGTLHIQPDGPYDVTTLRAAIERHGITLINCTPSAFYPLVEEPDTVTYARLRSLRVAFLGGEPIATARLRAWMTNPQCRAEIANTYGPTECTDICGAYRLTRDRMDSCVSVPLGRPIYNVQLAIVDHELNLCPIGTAGELCVGGAGIGAGYINDAALTAERFVPNRFSEFDGTTMYRTGDQARWCPDGTIEFLGRLDHQVKIRGFRIELHEIEAVLNSHPEVKEAVVVARTSTAGADAELACFFTARTAPGPTGTQLRDFASHKLPHYMVPGTLTRLDSFPLSPNGKVDRKALAASAPRDAGVPSSAPGEGLGSRIAAIWGEVLGRTDFSPDENFFDIGGTSIDLARVHTRLQSSIGREFPITDLFAHATIRSLVEHFSPKADPRTVVSSVQDRARRQQQALAARRVQRQS